MTFTARNSLVKGRIARVDSTFWQLSSRLPCYTFSYRLIVEIARGNRRREERGGRGGRRDE